jgi:phosphoglycolate phosphatase-like HAD superfamily hydrolase
MPEDHFGERVAERYDESAADMFEPAVVDPVVDVLADLAGHGAALELGIGTGRIALPSRNAASACTGSTSRERWSRGCGPSQVRNRSV